MSRVHYPFAGLAGNMVLSWFRRRDPAEAPARALYAALVRQARAPEFYGAGGVADTWEGRYDMILVHVFLVLERLNSANPPRDALKQALFDVLFEDMRINLRELGFGDTGVKIRLQRMVDAFYGRMTAYRRGLEAADGGDLAAALARNLFRHGAAPADDGAVAAMAAYVRRQWRHLQSQPDAVLAAGEVDFAAIEPREAAAHDA